MMMFAMFAYLMWIPVVVGLLALGVVLVVRSVSAPGWMRRGAACGGCGYELTSVSEARCPECGAGLLKVGVTTPRMALRLRGNMFLLVAGWTLVVVMGVLPVLGVIGSMATMAQMSRMTAGGGRAGASFSMSDTWSPQSFEYDSGRQRDVARYHIMVGADGTTGAIGQAESGVLTLTFAGGAEHVMVEIQLADQSWVMLDADGEKIGEGDSFDNAASLAAYAASGLDIEHESTVEEMTYLPLAVAEFAADPQMSTSGMSYGQPLQASGGSSNWSYGPGPLGGGGISVWEISLIGVVGGGVLIYVVGLVLLVRKRGRMLRGDAGALAA